MTISQSVAGAAALTTSATAFTASVPGTGATFTVASATGYPSSGAFTVQLDRGLASEEKILCSGRSGTTFTVQTRGYDGTTAQSHTNPAVNLILPATVVNALIDHVDGVELAPHASTLPVGTTTGHDTTTRHVFGAGNTALGVPGAATIMVPDQSSAAGSGSRPAREDHTHGITTATAVSVTTANAEGSSGSFSRADHTHLIGAGAINSAAMFAAGVVDAAAIATDGVGSAEIAAGAVGSSELAALAVTAGKIASGGVSTSAELADAIVTAAKIASFASTDYTPSAADFATGATLNLGTGGTSYGHYFKFGRLVAGWAGWNMAADGNLPSPGVLVIPLPVAMRTVGSDGFRCFVAARIRQAADGAVASGTGVITAGSSASSSLVTAGASAQWDATTPFNLGTPGNGAGSFDALFFYEAAT